MKLFVPKIFFVCFVLLVYVGIGAFGLREWGHLSEKPMPNCPYAESGTAICENTLGHIKNWQQFSSTTYVSLVILILFLGVMWYLSVEYFFNTKKYFYHNKCYLDNNKKIYLSTQAATRWLSLFENSPSL